MLDFITSHDLPAVLLIDDDMVSREVMATVLTMSGYPVHTAEGGEQAVALLAENTSQPSLILIDAQMPGLSGAALIKQLRRLSQAQLYVISASQPPAALLAKADGFLLKPFSPETLADLVGKRAVKRAPTAAPGLDPGETVIDPETRAQLLEMMPAAAVKQIYEAIVADTGRRIVALESAIAVRDWPETRRIGHAIKGGGLMAGAAQLARLGALIESGALETEFKDAPKVTTPVNQSDNSSTILAHLRAAASNLQGMLDAEFKA